MVEFLELEMKMGSDDDTTHFIVHFLIP